jgi:hypothetical protein
MSVTLTANGPKLPAMPELPALPSAPTTSADGAKLRRARVGHSHFLDHSLVTGAPQPASERLIRRVQGGARNQSISQM